MEIVRKVIAAAAPAGDPLEFVMSDETIDRMGEVILADGWQLDNFRKNPIALFGHNSSFVIGTWSDYRIQGKQLIGRLNLMPPVSDRLREIHAAVGTVLRAVSVGFHALEREGNKFTKSELVECSLVAVPANPNALQVAKSLNLSRETMGLIFGKPADGDQIIRRDLPGKPAAISTPSRGTIMNYAEKIERAQDRVVALKDQFEEHAGKYDVGEMDEEALKISEELQRRIVAAQRELDMYRDAERAVATRSDMVTVTAPPARSPSIALPPRPPIIDQPRPFAMPAKKIDPMEYLYRALTVAVVAYKTNQHPTAVRQMHYGDDPCTKVISDVITRAATAPADTTTSGWASQLVQTVIADFMESLIPDAVYPKLSAAGLRLTFGRNGVISVPTRSATPTIAGSFVGEGAPIPVRQGAFTAATLVPKKMAVISTMTREIAEHSIPAIEQLIRDAMQEDTSVAIDTVLLDATAASAIRPAGIRNGVAAETATTGGGLAALVGDIALLTGALLTATNGRVRSPVWIMNPTLANAAALLQNGLGLFPFREELNGGMMNRWPVIASSTVTAGMLILVDAADFASVTDDEPRFDVSDQATLHMEDTTPLPLVGVGSPGAIPAPVRSLWQTDTVGIRMILPMNWTLRRTGSVHWIDNVTWD